MMDNRNIPIINTSQLATIALKYKTENNMGIMLLKIPKRIAPVIFANTNNSVFNGAINKRSNERDLRSKVMVTERESIDVVPKRIDMATIPGNTLLISKVLPDFTNIISIHANGNIMPQLILGGFR